MTAYEETEKMKNHFGEGWEEKRRLTESYKPVSFCWCCGRKLWNKNKPTVRIVDGFPRTMHKFCSNHIDWMSQEKEGKNE